MLSVKPIQRNIEFNQALSPTKIQAFQQAPQISCQKSQQLIYMETIGICYTIRCMPILCLSSKCLFRPFIMILSCPMFSSLLRTILYQEPFSIYQGGEDLTSSAPGIMITPLKFFARNNIPPRKIQIYGQPPFHENLPTFCHFLKWLYLPFHGQ